MNLHTLTYLQHWSCAQYGPLHPAGIALLTERSQAVDQEVGALSLSWATFPRDDNTLVDLFPEHGVVGHIGYGENVRLQFAQLVILVHLHVLGVVDGQEHERVDGDEDASCIGVDLFLAKARPQII